MSTPVSPNCPQCGAALPSDAPKGLCPRCLAAMNLATQTEMPADEFGPEGTRIMPPSPRTAPLSPAELAPHFPQLEILECLGRGGMGVVYKARQKSLNRFVALKLLAPERVQDAKFAERFTREAQALAVLNHPNIVTVYDFGQAGGFYFLLMEFVDGLNLRQLLHARKLAPAEALAIVPPICEALQYAHEHGIVHRDIKPENLLLDKDGRVKIADFGIAKMLGAAAGRGASLPPSERQAGATAQTAAGTPGYMAPEQCAEPQKADHRADIYSLGVVLYELLTGELPGQRLEAPSRKVQIDVRLDEIVMRALEKTPELRYQTAADFRTQIETVVHDPATGRPANRTNNASPRLLKAGTSYVITPESLATFRGQFFLYRNKRQLLLDDRQLTFAGSGANTVIPLATIRDLSIGHYPRMVNPAGLDLISVTYDADGQARRLFFSPFERLFGLPSRFNEVVAEWFNEIRAAAAAATGRAPGHTPAEHLSVPSSSKVIWAWMLTSVLVVPVLLVVVYFLRSQAVNREVARAERAAARAIADVQAEVTDPSREGTAIARLKLQQAEVELERMAKLHVEHLVSQQELDEARLKVELARAELAGNPIEGLRARLRKAGADFERMTKLHAEHLVSQQELDEARLKVELARAELAGNPLEGLRARLRKAEADFERASELRKQNFISESEYDQSKSALAVAREALDKALQRKTPP